MTMQEQLINWYIDNHRKLPWRTTHNPYYIWLSEVMCQQTQVATVIDYYERFIQRFPHIEDLAKAHEDQVYKLWEGLGYYSRAKRLMLCAREVVAAYEGVFPKTYKEIVGLPGIGPYTAGAVLSIAYGVKEPAIDGNVMRVYSRLHCITEDVGKGDARKVFDPYVRKDLPDQVSFFNQGLMELGATICTPTKPLCDQCPIKDHCQAKEKGIQDTLPVKAPKAKKKIKKMTVAYIQYGDQVLVEKRGTEGLLANLWGFPIVASDIDMVAWLEDTYGLKVTRLEEMVEKKHVFTHLVWEMTMIRYKAEEKIVIDDPEVHWTEDKTFKVYPLPTAFRKLL